MDEADSGKFPAQLSDDVVPCLQPACRQSERIRSIRNSAPAQLSDDAWRAKMITNFVYNLNRTTGIVCSIKQVVCERDATRYAKCMQQLALAKHAVHNSVPDSSAARMMNADQRQGNLSEEQVALMSTFVSENRDALFGKAGHCSQRVLKRKEETWQRLLTSLEAQGLPKGRTWKDIRCAWNSWTSKAKKYRLRRTVTGGGPAPRYNTKYEAVLAAQAPQALDGFVGLEGETFIEADLPMTGSQNAEASAMLLDMVEQEVLDVEEPHAEPHAEPQAQPQAQPHAQPQAQPQAEPHAEPHSSRSANTPNSTGLEESYQERFLKLEQRKVEVLEKILTALTDIAHKLP